MLGLRNRTMLAWVRMNAVSALLAILLVAILLSAAMADDPPPFFEEIGSITPKRMALNNTLTFGVKADEPGSIIASDLPNGGTFTDHGDGTGTFEWIPRTGQEGITRITFTTSPTLKNLFGGQQVNIMVSGFPLSHGIYRPGYESGQDFICSQDHLTHTPMLKLDLVSVGYGPTAMKEIRASADGRIRTIVDNNNNCCDTTNCAQCNNFVWLEHANGEWTKYTHFRENTVTDPDTANLGEGACITSGTFLGYEGDVGHTSGSGSQNRFQQNCDTLVADTTKKCGIHLHFEVRMNSTTSGLRLPLLCNVPGFVAVKDQLYTAQACDANACSSSVALNGITYDEDDIKVFQVDDTIRADTVIVEGTASVAFFAGNKIKLKPGFIARTNSYFHAMINECNGSPIGCPEP